MELKKFIVYNKPWSVWGFYGQFWKLLLKLASNNHNELAKSENFPRIALNVNVIVFVQQVCVCMTSRVGGS